MIIDISWPITNQSTTYKDRNDIAITEKICLHPHVGTHVDAPAHFVKDGNTIDKIDLSKLIGPCRVLDLTHVEEVITKKDLIKFDIQSGERILFKTKNSTKSATESFDCNFVYLDANGAQFLAEKNIACVGIDYLGIEREQENHLTHIAFLEKNIPIIEGLRLAHVTPGTYRLICLPLKLHGLDGAPARAILTK